MRWVTIEVDDENLRGQEVQNSNHDDTGECCVVDRFWVTAERFESARHEWAKHAVALRSRLNEAEARAAIAEGVAEGLCGLTAEDIQALVSAARLDAPGVRAAVEKWEGVPF